MKKRIALFSAVILPILALVLWFGFIKQDPNAVVLSPLFPHLEKQMNTVDRITLDRNEGQIVLLRRDGAWFVSGYPDLPASFATVRRSLLGLSDVKIVEEKTKNPEYYAPLRVDDPKTKGSGAVKVTLFSGKTPQVSFFMGKEEPLLSGAANPDFYLRVGDTVYWVREFVPFLKDPKAYLDHTLITVDPSRVQTLRWTSQQGSGMARRVTPFSGAWVDDAGNPVSMPDQTRLQSMMTHWFETLRFSDVMPIKSVDTLDKKMTITLQTFDGMQIVMNLYSGKDPKTLWGTLQSSLVKAPSLKTWENQKPKDFVGTFELQPMDIVASDVAELTAKAKQWAFRVPPYPMDFLWPQAVDQKEKTTKKQ